MSAFVPDMTQLRGLGYEVASLYGMPHVGAAYTGGDRYERTSDRCAVCGRSATNVHHVAHRKWGRTFRLSTPNGTWILRSPLFALCGSGTTGCHDGFHGGAWLRARWVWDSDEYEAAWWSGELLSRFGAHDPALYAYGRWEVENTRLGIRLSHRGG